MDETSNDRIFPVDNEDETDVFKQKFKRKIDERRSRGLKGLLDSEYKEQAWKAMVSAIEKDVRQRFFMHQEKLRELQQILSNQEISPKEVGLLSHLCFKRHIRGKRVWLLGKAS
jgi:hypothetical protein